MTTFELLTKTAQPVTITVSEDDPREVRAELGDLSITWVTHEDCNPAEELASFQTDINAAAPVLSAALRRVKLVQSVRQALAVAYALSRDVSVQSAWDHLVLSEELSTVAQEGGQLMRADVAKARETAHDLLAAQLRAHGWTKDGTTPSNDLWAEGEKLLDLDTGRLIERREGVRVVQDSSAPSGERTEEAEYWEGEDGQELRAAEAQGRWWHPKGNVRRLPFDPWEQETHIVAEKRARRS